MDLETAANPAGEGTVASEEIVTLPNPMEANTPAEGVTEAETQTEEANDPLAELAAEVVTAEPELVEIEVDGKRIKVSEEGKEYLLREADYRRKTMDVAEQRRAIEAERASLQEQAKVSEAEFKAHVNLTQLNAQIEEYQQIDWSNWMAADPQAAQAARWQYDEILRNRDQIQHALSTYEQGKTRQQQQEFATLRRECLETVAREIPNWSDERRDKLEAFAVTLGVPEAEAKGIAMPWGYKVLHLAEIGQQFIDRQRAAAKMKAASAASPVPQVGSSAAAGKDPNSMTPAEYIAWRNSGGG